MDCGTRWSSAMLAIFCVAACATSGTPSRDPGAGTGAAPVRADSASVQRAGSLRQEDITLRFQLVGVHARAFPMDESIIRLLAPDSYRLMREQLATEQRRIESARRAFGYDRFAIWQISFFGLERDARFSPSEVVISAAGRDYRPVEIIPLTAGFGRQSLEQRETQTALYLFDPALDPEQPIEVSIENARNSEWSAVLRIIERERIRVRAGRIDTAVFPIRTDE